MKIPGYIDNTRSSLLVVAWLRNRSTCDADTGQQRPKSQQLVLLQVDAPVKKECYAPEIHPVLPCHTYFPNMMIPGPGYIDNIRSLTVCRRRLAGESQATPVSATAARNASPGWHESASPAGVERHRHRRRLPPCHSIVCGARHDTR